VRRMALRISRGRFRCLRRVAAVAAAAFLVCVTSFSPGRGASEEAGSTSAVLSFIDAEGGGVEVVRHWPEAPSDVTVYPFVPYFWDACPGPGAIMMLISGGPGAPPLLARTIEALKTLESADADTRREIARLIQSLRTPGDPAQEALKAVAPWVSDLRSYERWGYAVFLFIHWQGVWCTITVSAVPEGYGIPFVR
jgi:hypothetical protein